MKGTLLLMILVLSLGVLGQAKDDLPLPDPGNVTLSLEEYNKLVELAGRPIKKPDVPPLPYAVKRAELKLHVANESVLGTVQFEGEIFKKGETKVPLIADMTILDARQEGKVLPLELEGGKHVAVLPGPSEFSVALDAGLPLSIEAGRASFSLPVPSAGSVRLTLVIPGDHTNVRINPGLITARNSDNGHTTIEATLVPGRAASIWWATREIATPAVQREVRFLSDVRTLVSVDESGLKVAALTDVTVLQGEPSEFTIAIPAGYDVTEASGASLESSELQSGVLTLKLSAAAQHNYQFLISMEGPRNVLKTDAPILSFKDNQRETGEVLVEGVGTMELTATESGGLKRIDLKEINPYLRSLARFSPQAAFRYHRQPTETPHLALEWVRFPDSPVLAAVAERAVVTTLVTSDGKSLTEVKLTLKNQAQPYLKVDLPQGASILTAEVAGEEVKPAKNKDDGTSRVPLLRPGFRPTGPYEVSFVFMHSGAPFAKKGGSDLTLPPMDLPISFMQWEVFLPEQYKVKDFGGDAVATNLLPPVFQAALGGEDDGVSMADVEGRFMSGLVDIDSLVPGQLGGYIVDQQGTAMANTSVHVVDPKTGVTFDAVTDEGGRWLVSDVPSGNVTVSAESSGFNKEVHQFMYDARRPTRFNLSLRVGSTTETVEVNEKDVKRASDRIEHEANRRKRQRICPREMQPRSTCSICSSALPACCRFV